MNFRWSLFAILVGALALGADAAAEEAVSASQPAAEVTPAAETPATPEATPSAAVATPAEPAASTATAAAPQTKPAAASAPVKKEKPTFPAEAVYQDGFILRTLDKKFELKPQASAQLDTRGYFGDSVAPMSFDIRRARLDFNGKAFGDLLTVRIQAAMEDSPYIRNALADLRVVDAFHVRVGQMKVPFSSSWLAFDNQVDFMERATAEPIYPFFDRGVLLWGSLLDQTISYNLGAFTGAGVDMDANKGDIDTPKDIAWRVFVQPFKLLGVSWIEGIYLAGDGTWGLESSPTRRFETRGLSAPDYESQVWRWRTEQVLGDNGRNRDVIAATVDSRTRFGAELHYMLGSFTLSSEWAMLRYSGVRIYHDFWQGTKRLKHNQIAAGDGSAFVREGNVHNVALWASYFITGEKKTLDNFGWRQPTPSKPLTLDDPGKSLKRDGNGLGALEVLGRVSATYTDKQLFDSAKVAAYKGTDFDTSGDAALKGSAVGEGASVTAAVLDGAPAFYEATAGVNWFLSYNARVMLNYTYQWAPAFDADKKSGGIVSAGNSELGDATLKNKQVGSEHFVGLRFIFRI